VHVAECSVLRRGVEVVREIWQRSKDAREPTVVVVDVSPEQGIFFSDLVIDPNAELIVGAVVGRAANEVINVAGKVGMRE